DQGRTALHDARSRLPIEWVPPAVALIRVAARAQEHVEEMDGTTVRCPVSGGTSEKREAHRVVGVGDRKPLRHPEEAPRGRGERLAENHRRDGQRAEKTLAIIQRLSATADGAGEEALVIVRRLAVLIKPRDEPTQGVRDLVDRKRWCHSLA